MQECNRMKAQSQTDIARELGLSKAAVSKLKAQGMPCTSADAARRWRAEHLAPGRIRADPGPSPRTLVARAHELRDLAGAAQCIGRLDLVAPAARAALRAVPGTHRGLVRLAPWLWVDLAGRMAWLTVADHELTGFDPERLTAADGEPVPMPSGLYALAAGELVA
jgi:hypothetical protein